MDHEEKGLPKWAQRRLAALRTRMAELESRLEVAEDVRGRMAGHYWFMTDLPWRNSPVTLFALDTNQAISVCTLYPGDAMFIGRGKT